MTVVEKNAFDDRRPELRHPVGQPGRHTTAVQRQVRNSRTLHTSIVYVPRRPHRFQEATANVQIALRLPGPDVEKARELAARKGIGYQTLIKILIVPFEDSPIRVWLVVLYLIW